MAVQLKNSRNKLKISAVVGAVVVGSFIVLKTFPHLRDSIYDYLTNTSEVEEDNEPIELDEKQGQTKEDKKLEGDENLMNGNVPDAKKNDTSQFETKVVIPRYS